MITLKRGPSLEILMGRIIYLCLGLLAVSVLGLKLMDTDVSNIELVDRGLYTVITEKGPVNIDIADVLRIERTFTKAAVTGNPVELDKIYTKHGFIYTSSTDTFSQKAHELINSLDYNGLKVWQRPNLNLEGIEKYGYAIGTPANLVPIVFFLLDLQSLSLTIGALSLLVLIFPRSVTPGKKIYQQTRSLEPEYKTEDEKLKVLAK